MNIYSIVYYNSSASIVAHYYLKCDRFPTQTEVARTLNLNVVPNRDVLYIYEVPSESIVQPVVRFRIGDMVIAKNVPFSGVVLMSGTVVGFRDQMICVRDQKNTVWDCNPNQLTRTTCIDDPEDDMS